MSTASDRDKAFAELLLAWARTIEQHRELDFWTWLSHQTEGVKSEA